MEIFSQVKKWVRIFQGFPSARDAKVIDNPGLPIEGRKDGRCVAYP
jgi:hypothetical protein